MLLKWHQAKSVKLTLKLIFIYNKFEQNNKKTFIDSRKCGNA